MVLDLDETLVCAFPHGEEPPVLRGRSTFSVSAGGAGRLAVFQRPGLNEFLLRLSGFADVVVFTASAKGAGPSTPCMAPHGPR